MKDPAILFYTQDFLIGSSLLTPLQKGHYITILCYQQQSETGSLTLDEIKSLMKSDFAKHWPTISKKFKEDESGFFNERMRKEVARRRKHSDAQRENINKRWGKKNDTTVIPRYENGKELVIPLETATEIVNIKERMPDSNSKVSDAEKFVLGNQIEFEKVCYKTNHSIESAKKVLRKYHLWLLENEKYPKSRQSIFPGLEKWLMSEKPEQVVNNDKSRWL